MGPFNLGAALEKHETERKQCTVKPFSKGNAIKRPTILDCVLHASELQNVKLPHKQMFLCPIIEEGRIIIIVGWRGVGKTWFAVSLIDAITRGLDFGPWEFKSATSCLYLDGEMAIQDIQARYKTLNPEGQHIAPLVFYSDAYASSLGMPRASLLNRQWRAEMKKALLELEIKVFVIDNIASLAPGIDENSKQAWDPINQWLIDLRFSGITTILLHHTNKDGGQRGTSAREDNVDLSIVLKQPPDYTPDSGADFIVSFSKSRVTFADLLKLQDCRFTLSELDGVQSWQWRNVKTEIKEEAIRMIDQKMDYKDIAAALGISKGRVSQIKSAAIKAGVLNSNGRYKR